ncbi:hypothetical protein N5923_18205 [Erwiniaceae bacterium BAC15a-03b]|uniref:Uncharacterized protein n=1 Tax=Winslowiella arboricola TaxID=2978220 RepID=A0A9J6PSM8_9GAMM|nr:hypothetical protein [Winslowiella arboricola]MCU5775730.1 hypothetical protein [Winslowiella arboricola]MCU5779419.1 hypothetical protein [Winslowiella arboricola]
MTSAKHMLYAEAALKNALRAADRTLDEVSLAGCDNPTQSAARRAVQRKTTRACASKRRAADALAAADFTWQRPQPFRR